MSTLLAAACDALSVLPFECLEPRFMRRALLALLLLTPMTSMLGVQVTLFRMAFFSDAVGHSAFAGVALGLILGAPPETAMLVFGVLVGIAVMAVQRSSGLSADTAIGIIFSAVVAFGLAVVSRASGLGRQMGQFLYGDILTVGDGEMAALACLFGCLLLFELMGWNRLLAMALSPVTARVEGIHTAFWNYLFAAVLALVVMFSVRAVGVLLMTALLVVPAATARNLARSAGDMFWWSLVVGVSSGAAGLLLSAQEWLATASGATVVLVACAWFAVSCVVRAWRK
ncbi:MAG: metal ABC transporter permease [Desulfovibrio sp.]|uniref:metal ABC transporter permease n=1 Tax=Desulfovibrio sp. TaxID=885 RepID=UPI001A78A8CD|nr:metal ABC transporter permease [Desulfovibrio sp.]MBD5417745.1 metal ABC transporter permease [Desulfovibrio sp.]